MGLILDSSVLIDAERAGTPLTDLLSELGDDRVTIAALTASELLHGLHRSSKSRRASRETFLESLFSALPVLAFDLVVARIHARVGAQLASKGTIVGAHDLIIGATALAHDLSVVTRDARSFPKIPGLAVLRR